MLNGLRKQGEKGPWTEKSKRVSKDKGQSNLGRSPCPEELASQLQRLWVADSLQLSATSASPRCTPWTHTPPRVWPVISGGNQDHISFEIPTKHQAKGWNKGLASLAQCRTLLAGTLQSTIPPMHWQRHHPCPRCDLSGSSCPSVSGSEVEKHCSVWLFVAIKWSLSQKSFQNYLRCSSHMLVK